VDGDHFQEPPKDKNTQRQQGGLRQQKFRVIEKVGAQPGQRGKRAPDSPARPTGAAAFVGDIFDLGVEGGKQFFAGKSGRFRREWLARCRRWIGAWRDSRW